MIRRPPSIVSFVSVLVLTAARCATAPPPAAAPGGPRYPDYVFPVAPAGLARDADVSRHQAAWRYLQAGDLGAAERGFAATLRRQPGFFPAEAGLGYVDLARERYDEALRRFDDVLARQPDYPPALVGRGEALLSAGRAEDALNAFETALAIDQDLSGVQRRIDVLRFRAQEALVARARMAVQAGQLEAAGEAYSRALAASPDSPFLHRELADLDRRRGRLDAALAHARRALELDPGDARSHATLAEVLVGQGEYDAALASLERAAEIDPEDALERRIEEVRDLAESARLPEEYRAIRNAPAVTRADLAALIGVRLQPMLTTAPQREGVFITDTREHWAAPWILDVARAGVMEVYPNYTFQPGAVVRRGELATVVARVLGIIASSRPPLADQWQNPSYAFTDLPPGHLRYPAAALAVTAGVITVLENETFQLAREVSGREAVTAVNRLRDLLGHGDR